MQLRGSNSVQDFNIIKSGLNFLVPSQWWGEFIRSNSNVSNWDDITTPHEHPLSMLFDLGILILPKGHSKDDLARFESKAQNIGRKISNTFKQKRSEKLKDCEPKCLQQTLEVLSFDKFEETAMSVLLCPQVQSDLIKELMFDTFEWKVVTPHIYKAISERVCCRIRDQSFGSMIGVPIFLDEATEMQECTSKTYNIGAQIETIIFTSNAVGAKNAVIGFIQQKMSYESIIRQLFEGVNKLTNRQWLNNNYFTRKSIFVVNGEQIYENFMSLNDPVSKGLKNQFGLRCWYENFASQVPSKKMEILQFSGQQEQQQYSFKRINGSKHQFQNMIPNKKIKQNQSQAHIAGYTEIYSRTKQFQPKIIQQSGKRHIDTTQFNYHQLIKINQRAQSKIKKLRKRHSSTEEDTPHSIIHDSIQNQLRRLCQRDDNRIVHHLWKSEHNVQALIKLGEIKMSEHISVPFSSNASIVKRLPCGKRIFLGGRINQLTTDSEGDMIEENKQLVQEDSKDSYLNMVEMLQQLALQITGKKQANVCQIKNEQGVVQTKQKTVVKTEIERNQAVDQLDDVESQEY